jgi:hypothetical protein
MSEHGSFAEVSQFEQSIRRTGLHWQPVHTFVLFWSATNDESTG